MERMGMRREGQMREATIGDGGWTDVFIYGILASEWRHLHPAGLLTKH